MSILEYILDHNAKPDIWDYFKSYGGWLVENDHSFLLVCMFTTILVSGFKVKMQLATEAVKFKFDSLNPVNGLKRIFGLKNRKKNLLKQFFYIIFCIGEQSIFGVIINHCFLKTLDGDIISFIIRLGRDAIPSYTVLSRQYDNCLNFLIFIAEYFFIYERYENG
ncbi:EscU/YscU/HrcU family type III secretion system export apparatus switch protein [Escherichia coli]